MADRRLAVREAAKLRAVQKLIDEGGRPGVEGVRSLQNVSYAVIGIPSGNTQASPDFRSAVWTMSTGM